MRLFGRSRVQFAAISMLVFVLAIAGACTPVRVWKGVSGQVVDAETARPIGDAPRLARDDR